MNEPNTTGIRITRRDYFRLPASMRMLGEQAMVLSTVNGRQTFVLAIIVD